ncbi:hypothetical protein EGI15_07265 [Chryseobacterium cucumeris]|uniref:Uncharacterized protein n=2 Tax=Chryseobacterium cucumeris TaxID=1813611 RepID=A0ABX9X878_9FLAO|nr:hypothetical protein [Chryseobacterium cucumeris]ROH94284.1 hypothetical protein EGI15_07265 [Chryseobacterium cucumeris]
MENKLEILKASVPFATLTGVVVGALLNSRLARKDKIRDHLFSYKVKSYSVLAESIIEIRTNLEELRSSLYPLAKKETYDASYVWEKLRKVVAAQALFLSDNTSKNLRELSTEIFAIVEYETLNRLMLQKKKYEEEQALYTVAIFACTKFIREL